MKRKRIILTGFIIILVGLFMYNYYQKRYANHYAGPFFTSNKWSRSFVAYSNGEKIYTDLGANFYIVRVPPLNAVELYNLILKYKIIEHSIDKKKPTNQTLKLSFYKESDELPNTFSPSDGDIEWGVGVDQNIVSYRKNLIAETELTFQNSVQQELIFRYFENGKCKAIYHDQEDAWVFY